MNITCPKCKEEIDVTDQLPERACDTEEIECDCGAYLVIGWYATATVEVKD